MLTRIIQEKVTDAIVGLYQTDPASLNLQINTTKPEFEGDYTVVLFTLVKQLKKSPEALGTEIGARVVADNPQLFTGFNVIKGFLNLGIADSFWWQLLNSGYNNACYGKKEDNGQRVMVEYSSPNTNKPLHLGHLRNNFLGWSMAEIYKASGYEVIKSCIINDRGIHICKSMIAWQRFANGATPESAGIKGDHLVGEYYVQFNDAYKAEAAQLVADGMDAKQAEKEAPIMKAAQQMLQDWEAGDPAVLELWRTMNSWVYAGFDDTYKKIGSDFDEVYYESNTYLLGKEIVQQGLEKGVFFKKEDGSVWIDLVADGLDEKLVQRRDGTSVYITQDIGLAQQKYDEYKIDQSIYVIGNEQDYHMQVLKLICQKLGLPYANGIYHLSYGMVELPEGKMKSREGTVVDADDMVAEMLAKAAEETEKNGKTAGFTGDELKELFNTLGLGAMKFYLLRVDPKKRMVFNPKESIDFHGFTGPFIQYTHARIRSILRKVEESGFSWQATTFEPAAALLPLEKKLALMLEQYPAIINEACTQHDPSVIATYIFQLAQSYNSFYTEHSVANAENEEKKILRLRLSQFTAGVIKSAMKLLGIAVPERM